ncbi:MAG: hypothetical protein H6Q19_123 [Bacteroidetes bacterium]|nr:hypothetical protein [Bacteroidota bacterium]
MTVYEEILEKLKQFETKSNFQNALFSTLRPVFDTSELR